MPEETPVTLERIYGVVKTTQKDVEELKSEFRTLNGTVRDNHTDIAVLKDWRQSHAGPAVNKVSDLRVEIVKVAGIGSSIAVVLGLILLFGKLAGVF